MSARHSVLAFERLLDLVQRESAVVLVGGGEQLHDTDEAVALIRLLRLYVLLNLDTSLSRSARTYSPPRMRHSQARTNVKPDGRTDQETEHCKGFEAGNI